jgi:hypothetical protein
MERDRTRTKASKIGETDKSSVADPEPNPYVFGPPNLDPLVQRTDPAPDPSFIKKMVRKTLIPPVL